jgi:hypothetical protein
MNMSEVWNQSAFGSFYNGDRKSSAVSVGFGTFPNQLQLNSNYTLQTTNSEFYLIGASFNKAVIQLNLPFKSDSNALKNKVDTKLGLSVAI